VKRLSFLVALLLGMVVLVACPRGSVEGPLAAPTNVQATPGSGEIVLTWQDNSTAEEGFRIYRKLETDEEFSSEFLATTLQDEETYTDTSVSAADSYVYQVRAFAGETLGEPSNATEPESPILAEDKATLTILRVGSGQGVVTSSPTGIDCINRTGQNPGSCSFDFDIGTVVTLSATPDLGSQFTEWGGDCAGQACVLTLDTSKTVNVTFAPIANRLIVTKRGDGEGLVTSDTTDEFRIDCGTKCEASSEVTTVYGLRAEAAPDSVFAGWNLPTCADPTKRCFVTIGNGQGAEVIATFLARRDAPVINTFSASPAQVAPLGTPVVLSWDITYSGTDYELEITDSEGNSYDTTGRGLVEDSFAVGSFDSATTFTLEVTTDFFGSDTAQDSVTVGDGPRILTFEVGDTTITSADDTTLDWEVENADSVTLTIGDGTPETVPAIPPTPRTVSPDVTTEYTLTATKDGFAPVEEQRTITIGTVPVITRFSSDPPAVSGVVSVEEDTPVTLDWRVTGARTNGVTLNGTTVAANPTTPFDVPTDTVNTEGTLYTLAAINDFGPAPSQQIRVIVTAAPDLPPIIAGFSASDTTFAVGGVAEFTWGFEPGRDAPTGLTLLRNGNPVPACPVAATDISATCTITAGTTSFSLRVQPGGNTVDPIPFTLGEPPAITNFEATAQPNGDYLLEWDDSGTEPITYSLTTPGGEISVPTNPFTLPAASATPGDYTLNASNNYSLEANEPGTDSFDFEITPPAPPPVISNFDANDKTVLPDSTVNLFWDVTGEESLSIDHGVGSVTGSDNRDVTVGSSDITYRLTATNAEDVSVTDDVTIEVSDITITFSASPEQITRGEGPSILSWTVDGAETLTVTIDNEVGEVEPMDSEEVSPTDDTTYTLTASNDFGTRTATATVVVNEPAPIPPAIGLFEAEPATIEPGGSSTLSWEVTGTEPVSVDLLENGVLFAEDLEPVGSLPVTPTPEGDYIYTLNAANEAGSDSEERTVTVEVPDDDDEG
jgi:hypothetical protein